MIRFDHTGIDEFLDDAGHGDAVDRITPRVEAAHRAVTEGTGAGSEWLGWRRILKQPNDALLEDIERTALEIRSRADVLVCIGIGGSYLGAAAVIDALTPAFRVPAAGKRRYPGRRPVRIARIHERPAGGRVRRPPHQRFLSVGAAGLA